MVLIWFYSLRVTAHSVTERGNSNICKRRTNAIRPLVGVFLCLSNNGSRARATLGLADDLLHRISTPCTAAALIRGKIDGSSKISKGAIVMANLDKSRLCTANRVLSILFKKYFSLTDYQLLNQQLQAYALSCLANRKNPNLNQAYYHLTHCLKNGLFSGSALERAEEETSSLLDLLHRHLDSAEVDALNRLLVTFADTYIAQHTYSLAQFKVAYQQLKSTFIPGGV